MSILHAHTGIDLDDTQVGFAYRSTRDLEVAYALFKLLRWGPLVKLSNAIGASALRWGLPVKPLLRHTLGRLFLGGESLPETMPLLKKLHAYGVTAMLDYAAEASTDPTEQEKTLQEYLQMIAFARAHPEWVSFIAVKLTALASPLLWEKLTHPPLPPTLKKEEERFRERFEKLLTAAQQASIPLMVDAEESWLQTGIDLVVEEYMQRFNQQQVVLYTTVQMYRRDRLDYLERLLQRASSYQLGIKLVRGAYVEKERKRAQAQGYADPIHPSKTATDLAYDAALLQCLERLDHVALCVATHNRNSCMKAAQFMILHNRPPNHPHLWFSQLYGMADPLSFGLAKAGFRVAKYVPYGPIEKAFPYLSRRAEENSSLSDQSGRELAWITEELTRRRKLFRSR
ncbi:MAG: hypothetical protein D6750_08030 [Bacteroidetes bacterium]|nr:MAG: hypothetical protein D6750_08030 [Bacteroidota bacterium]